MATQKSYRKHITKKIDVVFALAYLSANQTALTAGSANKINMTQLSFDVAASYDTTNHRFVAPVRGLYRLKGFVMFTSVIATHQYIASLYVNGAEYLSAKNHASTTDDLSVSVETEVFLNENDYVELYANPNAGANTVAALSGLKGTQLMVRLITKEGIRQ